MRTAVITTAIAPIGLLAMAAVRILNAVAIAVTAVGIIMNTVIRPAAAAVMLIIAALITFAAVDPLLNHVIISVIFFAISVRSFKNGANALAALMTSTRAENASFISLTASPNFTPASTSSLLNPRPRSWARVRRSSMLPDS